MPTRCAFCLEEVSKAAWTITSRAPVWIHLKGLVARTEKGFWTGVSASAVTLSREDMCLYMRDHTQWMVHYVDMG
jgi:hypothetical protein